MSHKTDEHMPIEELNQDQEHSRIIHEAIDAANFRRHECEVSECGGRLCVSVSGITDDTTTRETTIKELWRLCNVIGLNYDDHKYRCTHSNTFACTGVDGFSLADIVARIRALKAVHAASANE